MTFEQALIARVSGFCSLSPEQIAVLQRHYEKLVQWNLRLNLTSVIELEQAVPKHYAESLFLAVHLPPGPLRIADIGSGGGFPGFPAAVLRPDVEISLVESDTRKSVFLKEIASFASNVQVLNVRAQHLNGRFDWIVTRAVNLLEIGALMTHVAPRALALTTCGSSNWEAVAALPWDARSCVVSRGTSSVHEGRVGDDKL